MNLHLKIHTRCILPDISQPPSFANLILSFLQMERRSFEFCQPHCILFADGRDISFEFLPTSCYHLFADGPKDLWEWMQDAQFGIFWDILQPSFFANLMLFFFKPMIYFLCRWTKRPLGAGARCPVWDPCKQPSLPTLPHSSTAMAGWYVPLLSCSCCHGHCCVFSSFCFCCCCKN